MTSDLTGLELHATRLYGGAPAASAPAAATSTSGPADAGATPTSIAERLYAHKPLPSVEVPEAVAKLRESDAGSIAARLFTTPTPHPDVEAAMASIHADDPARAKAEAAEWGRVANDYGGSDEDIALVTNTIRRFAREMPTVEQEESMRGEAFAALDREYGDQAPRALQLARALAKRDPRLLDQLERSGAGNDPQIVIAMARAGHREFLRGRLKV